MAVPLTASRMLAALKAEGCTVVETKGWSTRGRDIPTGKPFGPVHGVMTHHTGSDTSDPAGYVQRILVDGYSGLPGPLCHVGIDTLGRVWMVSSGRSNHAGGGDGPGGSQDVLARVTADLMPYDGEVHPTERNLGGDDGNDVYYGAEVMYSGGHPMTEKQYAATVLWNAAICRAHGWTAGSCLGHREWSMDKPDPGHCDMAQLRRDVRARLAVPLGHPTPPRRPQVSLAALVKAARHDPGARQGATTAGSADDVRVVEAALVRERYLPDGYAHDGSYGTKTVTAYAAWQRECGYTGKGADGIPGRASLTKLGARYGFDVIA